MYKFLLSLNSNEFTKTDKNYESFRQRFRFVVRDENSQNN